MSVSISRLGFALRRCVRGRRAGVLFASALSGLLALLPREADAKGGSIIHLFAAQATGAEAATGSMRQPGEPILGGCGGKRYRDVSTHQCRGPADAFRY